MGILSLDQLLYLAKNYPGETQQMLNISHHPTIGFPLAVAGCLKFFTLLIVLGITFTAVTRDLLSAGELKKLFYQPRHQINLDLFNETYCKYLKHSCKFYVSGKIFIAFVAFWKAASPDSIMEFNKIRASFEQKLLAELTKEKCEIESIV